MTRAVLHVIATLDRGGTEVSCLSLCRGMAREGVENHVVALIRGDGGMAGAFDGVATAHGVLPAGRIGRAAGMTRLVRRIRPWAVVIHFFHLDHVVLGAVARVLGGRRLAVVQGNPPPLDARVRRKSAVILRATRALGLRLVSASAWIEREMATLGPLPARRAVIHNGVDVAGIAARASSARTREDGVARIGMIARLDPIKDHETLLAAMAALPGRIAGRAPELELVGDGGLRARLEARVRDLGLAGRVTFRGARSDVAAELARWDLFCLSTTRDEGFGVVLVEALAAGVPVLASDVPACREVLRDGALGTLVPAGDPAALAEAIRTALEADAAPVSHEIVTGAYGENAMAASYLRLLGAAG